MFNDSERHEPTFYAAGADFYGDRPGAWCLCSCGWKSGGYGNVKTAQYVWSMHVKDVATDCARFANR